MQDLGRQWSEAAGAGAAKATLACELTPAKVWLAMASMGKPDTKVGELCECRAGGTLDRDTVVLDVDATIVVAHSEKEQAAPTFKGTFVYHPIGVWCDNTGELLAASLRPGNAGANTAADHIEVLTRAMTQVPRAHRKTIG